MKRFALCTILILLFCVPAWAYDGCDLSVYDNTGKVDVAKIEMATNELVALGADVRIVILNSYAPYGNLDQYEAALLRECHSWQAANGDIKNNLIVMMVSMNERVSGLYYGAEYAPVLESRWNNIRTKTMGPYFRSGDFTEGFLKGLDKIRNLIGVQTASGPTVHEAVDLSGLWKILGWVFGSALVIVAGIFSGLGLMKWKRSEDVRRSAQRKAKAAKSAVTTSILRLEEPIKMAGILSNALPQRLGEFEAKELAATYNSILGNWSTSLNAYSQRNSTTTDPSGRYAEEDYKHIEAVNLSFGKEFLLIEDRLSRWNTKITDLVRALSHLPDLLTKTENLFATSASEIKAIEESGFKMTLVWKEMEVAGNLIDIARQNITDKNVSVTLENLRGAQTAVERSLEWARSYPKAKKEIEHRIVRCTEGFAEIDIAINAGRTAFSSISSDYAPITWQTVSGNGTEAEKRLAAAKAAVEAAKTHAEDQLWVPAQNDLSNAKKFIEQAEGFMRSILTLKTNLDAAKASAPGSLREAKRSLAEARGLVRSFKDIDVSEYNALLARLGSQLQNAEVELQKEKPNYLEVVKICREANEQDDKILETARTDQESFEATRRQAAAALLAAGASVDTAREYFEDHPDSVWEAGATIDGALTLLAKARKTSMLNDQIQWSDEARQIADRELREVREAHDRRQRSRRSSTTWGQSTPSYGGYTINSGSYSSSRSRSNDNDYGGGGGGGGSGGFGGFSSGGGSGSFGGFSGGGGGGGGSGGW